MLAALCEQIYNRYPFAKIALPVDTAYRERVLYGTYQLGRIVKKGVDIGKLLHILPSKVRNMFGIVMPSEIDAIIDASGFAYGDQWGAKKAEQRLAGNIVQFKRGSNRRKVIMLPQALGTFEDPALAGQMRIIFENADLVFARESASYGYAKAICDREQIKQAPDFSNLFAPAYQGKDDVSEYDVCLIPNSKMLEMKKGQIPGLYVGFMASLLEHALETGHNPYVLVHEGAKDLKLAQDIVVATKRDIQIIQPDTAADVKALIGKAKLVISSRFHGLVSALSQGVPVIATGWSHKYEMLLADYGMGEFLFDETNGVDAAKQAMSKCFETGFSAELAAQLSEKSIEQKQLTRAMWQQVFAELDDIVDA